MTVLLRGCDSAYAPDAAQIEAAKNQDVTWWGGYIGGADVLHEWSAQDFATVGDAGFKILPIWVPVQFTASFKPDEVVAGCLARCTQLGIPKGSAVAIDLETALSDALNSSPSTLDTLVKGITDGGYEPVIYGGGNLRAPQWKADWYGTSWPVTLPPGSAYAVGWQWSSGSASVLVPGVDLDVITQQVADKMWDGKSDKAVTAPVAVTPVDPTQVTTTVQTPATPVTTASPAFAAQLVKDALASLTEALDTIYKLPQS